MIFKYRLTLFVVRSIIYEVEKKHQIQKTMLGTQITSKPQCNGLRNGNPCKKHRTKNSKSKKTTKNNSYAYVLVALFTAIVLAASLSFSTTLTV
jgi:hypothetical protein